MTNYMNEDRYRYYESLGFTREQIDSDLAETERQESMDSCECEECGSAAEVLFWSTDGEDREVCNDCWQPPVAK